MSNIIVASVIDLSDTLTVLKLLYVPYICGISRLEAIWGSLHWALVQCQNMASPNLSETLASPPPPL